MPKVSVIVPVYNVEKELPDCLDSILCQSLSDIELIAVDDCGEDKSSDILKGYATKDNRVKIVSYGRNRGLSYARNRGLEKATGKYILFVDSDDMLTEGSLLALYNKIEDVQADGIMFDLESRYEDCVNRKNIGEVGPHKYDYPGVCTGQELFVRLKENQDLQLMAFLFMWNRFFLNKHKLFFHEGILHEDNPFSICTMMKSERICFLKRICYIYRRRINSITVSPCGYKNLSGMVIGNVDIIGALTGYNSRLEYNFLVAVIDFVVMVRRLIRTNLIKMISLGENVKFPRVDNVGEYIEWRNIIDSDYKYISGIMKPSVFKRIRQYKKIIIYGGGKIGLEVVRLLEEFGIKNYQVVVTTNNALSYGWSHNVDKIDSLADCLYDSLVIISVGEKLQDFLLHNVTNLGFVNIVKYKELFGKTT